MVAVAKKNVPTVFSTRFPWGRAFSVGGRVLGDVLLKKNAFKQSRCS